MTVGPKETRFIFDRGNRVWLLLFLLYLQVRTFPVSLWSVSEVSYFSVIADIHMSHFSNFIRVIHTIDQRWSRETLELLKGSSVEHRATAF